jgi:hypothetical protein
MASHTLKMRSISTLMSSGNEAILPVLFFKAYRVGSSMVGRAIRSIQIPPRSVSHPTGILPYASLIKTLLPVQLRKTLPTYGHISFHSYSIPTVFPFRRPRWIHVMLSSSCTYLILAIRLLLGALHRHRRSLHRHQNHLPSLPIYMKPRVTSPIGPGVFYPHILRHGPGLQ